MAENTNNNPTANANNNPTEAIAVTITEEEQNNDPKKEQDPMPKKKTQFKSLQARKIMLPLALITFLLSIPFLFQAIWLLYVQQYDCEGLLKSLPRSQILIAIALIFVFFLSNGVVYARARFPAPGLILVIVPLVLMFIMGLSLQGSFKTEMRRFPGSPRWLKMKVHNNNNWNNIKSCLYDTKTCSELVSRSYNLKPYDFTKSKLSPIEFGCCKPSSSCEMEYVNATYWEKSNKGTDLEINMPTNEDCDLWENKETKLCYDCDACKEAYIKTLEGKWLKLGTFLVVMSLFLMISHLLLFVATMWEQYGGESTHL